MKHLAQYAVHCVIIAITAAPLPSTAQTRDLTSFGPWELQRAQDGITIHTRDATRRGLNTRETRTAMTLSMPLDEVLDIVRGTSQYWLGLKQVAEVRDFNIASDGNTWHSYIVFDLPWPAKTQDLVVHCLLKQEGDGAAIITMESTPDLVPEQPSIRRMQSFSSLWTFAAIDAQTTRVTYLAAATSEKRLPGWITDPIVHKGLIRMFGAIRVSSEGAFATGSGE
ncbi:MAG: hypothetical protein R3301_15155 [Saprospiraceae bacterium]|nr:hypothetical protein [Saprospiraceae bacterium]